MKIHDVIILEQASWDINEGRDFYNTNTLNSGDYFFSSMITEIESLKFYAGIHRKHYGLHRMLAKRFPFAIYYDVEKMSARVIAVLDTRRNPSWIRKRLML